MAVQVTGLAKHKASSDPSVAGSEALLYPAALLAEASTSEEHDSPLPLQTDQGGSVPSAGSPPVGGAGHTSVLTDKP